MPNDLGALVGKRKELIVLATKDAAEARVRYAKASAEVETRWANLKGGKRSLTEGECHPLAGAAHDAWLRMHGEEPSEQFTWHPGLYRRLWIKGLSEELPGDGETLAPDDLFVQTMQRFYFVRADSLAHHGLEIDGHSRIKLAKTIVAAFQRASLTLADLAQGRLTPEEVPALAGDVTANPLRLTDTPTISPSKRSASASKKAPALSTASLFESWWREAQAAGGNLVVALGSSVFDTTLRVVSVSSNIRGGICIRTRSLRYA